MWATCGVDVPECDTQAFNRIESGLIIRVHTQKKVEITIPDSGQVVANHPLYNGRFFPTRHENGDAAFCAEWTGSRLGRLGSLPPKEVPEANERGYKIINAARNQGEGKRGKGIWPDNRE